MTAFYISYDDTKMKGHTMKIISVGVDIDHKNVSNEQFRSSVSFLDFDMLIWDSSNMFTEYNCHYNREYMGYRNLSDNDSPRILGDISRRKNEMIELLKLGRIVVLILPPPEKCYCATGQNTYSGTGRSRITNRIVTELYLLSTIPLNDLQTVTANGDSIEFQGNEPFKTYWEKMKGFDYYSAYLSSAVGKPFLFIKGTTKAVASYVQTEKGVFLILPSIFTEEYFKTKKEYTLLCQRFIDALIELSSELKKTTGDYSLPAWADYYFLPKEKEQKQALKDKEHVLQELLSQISRSKEEIAKTEKYKLLLSGSGRALEIQVANVLSEIGFLVEAGPEGRDDLVMKYGEKVAVVEIKGVSKSAAEKHAAQLEKWVAEYLTSHEVKPKGILIVNAFCNTPLNNRNEPPFPQQMIKYSTNREHCLITTMQLLGIYLTAISKPENRKQLINELFETNGVYQKFVNYKDYLFVEQEPADISENKVESS